jgi:hypothetical protein
MSDHRTVKLAAPEDVPTTFMLSSGCVAEIVPTGFVTAPIVRLVQFEKLPEKVMAPRVLLRSATETLSVIERLWVPSMRVNMAVPPTARASGALANRKTETATPRSGRYNRDLLLIVLTLTI